MYRLLRKIAILFFFCFACAVYAKTMIITRIDCIHVSGKSRIVFSANQPIKYHLFTLSNPDRLVVDFKNTVLHYNVNSISVSKSDILSIKTGHPVKNTLRFVFYFKKPLIHSAYILKPRGNLSYRLAINLLPTSAQGPVVITHNQDDEIVSKKTKTKIAPVAPKETETEVAPPSTPKVTMSAAQYQTGDLKKATVIIDPGHGGHDPGAIGHMGTYEKNVVLQISKDLYDILQKQPGIKVYMTRYTDNFVSLRGRLKVARKDKADLFVAIHADAYFDRNAQGVTVFALSPHGATSESARWLADRENYSELSGVSLSDKNQLIRSILLDISQTATISQSLFLGVSVRDALQRVSALHSHIVEQAAFVVLKSPDIPSILVETGFLSNRQQELQLRTGAFQMKVAQALAKGIEDYLHQYPPPGTVLAKT